MGVLNLYACIGYPKVEDEYLNKNSAQFHEHLGFRLCGTFENCGYKFNRWYDMIWMEKIIGEHTDDQAPVNLTPTPSNLLKGTRREGLGRGHLRDSGRVPLCLPKNAKDGGHVPQLASLRQVAHVLQRTLRQAKRKPAPFTQAVRAPGPPCAVYWLN